MLICPSEKKKNQLWHRCLSWIKQITDVGGVNLHIANFARIKHTISHKGTLLIRQRVGLFVECFKGPHGEISAVVSCFVERYEHLKCTGVITHW